MELKNTITLKPDEPEKSKDQLRSLLTKTDLLKVIIFGMGKSSLNGVETADVRAGAVISGIGRKAVWMQDTNLLTFLKTVIKDGPELAVPDIDLTIHIGISLSLDNQLMDLIPEIPEPDYIRMELAYLNAGTN